MPADAMNRVDVLRAARAEAGLLLVGLDFDGTLAPIVPVPDDAAMPETTRAVLHALTLRADTCVALVSGRGLADLSSRVRLDNVYLAGNHGLEIVGPDVHRMHPDAQAARPRLEEIAAVLRRELPPLPGVIVEDKGLTLSVHYRMVEDDADAEDIRLRVKEHAGRYDDVVLTEGKKVVEIRPAVEWNKGLAFSFLRDTIEAARGRRGPAVFIGDDRTDEDVFRILGSTDCSIIVGDPPPQPTIAHALLPSPEAVAVFLQRLLD
jgi:trehalose 6-phosphate phosphatase